MHSSATTTRCSAHTSSTAAATRRWGPFGATSISRRSAVRRPGRTRQKVTPRPRRTSGGTGTTTTTPRPRLTRNGSRCPTLEKPPSESIPTTWEPAGAEPCLSFPERAPDEPQPRQTSLPRPRRRRVAKPRGRADLRHHGAADGCSWWCLAGHALRGPARRITAERNGADVFADERLPFCALAEADLQPTNARRPDGALRRLL